MTSFQSVAGIKVQFGLAYINGLSSGNPSAGNDTVVQDKLDEATGKIKSYTNVRYPHGFETSGGVTRSVPDEIRRCAGEMARYYLCGEKVSATIQKKYDDNLAWLKDLASGKAMLSEANTAVDDTSPVLSTSETRLLTRSNLGVY